MWPLALFNKGTKRVERYLCGLIVALVAAGARAQAPSANDEQERIYDVGSVTIMGGERALPRVAGSAQQVDAERLELYEYDDLHRILGFVPGVYVREEDGFGLRPNVGMRGAASDRSAKITLMEDGVLLAPAPYAAPAAYYFPLMARMVGVEVFKGPASIQHGPNTIGGALNVQTRPLPPRETTGMLDLGVGQFFSNKAHAAFGGPVGAGFALLLEGVHIASEGFKKLDGGGDTGFGRDEVMLKAGWSSPPAAVVFHQLELKLGYSNERSNETYLGLSDEDFANDPYRRYPTTALGRMEANRTQVVLRYALSVGSNASLSLVAYRHDFHRTWRKLNGFGDGQALGDAFTGNAQSDLLLQILRGDIDDPDNPLRLGPNKRTYWSQGLMANGSWRLQHGPLRQKLEAGIRLHGDQVRRHHSDDGFLVVSQEFVRQPDTTRITTNNKGQALALAAFVRDTVTVGDMTVTPGLRVEVIRTRYHDALATSDAERDRDGLSHVLIPGLGLYYQLTEDLGLLAGVHKGFSPLAPGQNDAAKAEESWNIEAGTRLRLASVKLEAIGFFNLYQNLTGTCTASGGCSNEQIGDQYNAGAVNVVGLELQAQRQFRGPWGLTWGGALHYTFTRATFLTSFSSDSPLFGDPNAGDFLPYIPMHQGGATLELKGDGWEISLTGNHVGEMFDKPGDTSLPDGDKIPPHTVMDGAAYWGGHLGQVYLTVQNIFDNAYMASRRPYGARPGKPRLAMVGYKVRY